MNELLRDVAQLTAPRWRDAAQAEGRAISVDVACDPDAVVVGWPAALRDSLTNLVFNAVDALPNGGVIRLDASRAGERVDVCVADTGVGMSADVQARVFEPFFSTKGSQGTGLGLAQVFGIVEQHGGQISLESAVGRGTTFRLSLRAAAASLPSTEIRPGSTAGREKLRILAVDDEPAIAAMVVRVLRPLRHTVNTAGSAEEALERLEAEQFDIVVSDLGLGAGMSGWEFAMRVRDRWPDIRFILATGWGAEIDPDEASEKGVAVVLAKPYHPDELERAIGRAA
jgi:CheY-like chemotaxis protein